MLNKVILQGNVGRAPKLCLTQNGRELVNFSLATTHYWKDEAGEWQSAIDWHRITVFRESTIRWVKDVLRRGDPVYVEGTLSYHQWEDKYGQSRLTSHVLVAGREGCVKCLRQFSNLSLPSNLNLASRSNNHFNPGISPTSNSQEKSLSAEETISSEEEDEEQDIPFETPQRDTQLTPH